MKKLGLIALLMMAPFALMAETICAVVKIEIRQEVSFERQAFDAKMVITNGLEAIDLRDLGINVIFRDVDGNPVEASSNPNNTTAKFFITVDRIEGVQNASGELVLPVHANGILSDATAVIPAGGRAEIHWLIIPTEDAVADGNKIGEVYGVGANVSYTYGEESQTVEVAPDYIEVRPTPSLELDYFLPADVFADDPTTATVEPIEPFDLGLRIKNNGDGAANNLKIESAQPKIIQNDQGLLIDFLLLGTSVNDQPVVPSLLADIGDLPSEENAMVSWKMSTSLSGEFVEFTADFVHADELGGELTSLIESPIDTHTLLHKVLVDEAGRDGISDFLAYDEDVLRVYESDGQDVDVTVLSPAVIDNGIVNNRRQFTITVNGFVGPGFAQWSDVYFGETQAMTVIRNADQKVLPSQNIWQYKEETSPGTFIYSMGLFDSNGGGDYTLIVDGLVPNTPPEVTVSSPQSGYVGHAMSFEVLVTDADMGDVLSLTPLSMPAGAGLTPTGAGTWQFNWTPDAEGDFNVSLRASDGTVDVDVNVQLIVTEQDPNDTDGDGLLDAWEMEHFGDLDEDGTGDFDQDGATDKQEHDFGGDPTLEDRPQAVVIESPYAGAQVAVEPTEFMIVNSVGAVDADMVYEFELYENSLQNLFFSETIAEAELSTTLWTHGQVLAEDVRYILRVRAFDGATYSTWTYDDFFFSANNDAPAFCGLDYPENGLSVNDAAIELAVNLAIDPENDALQYRFEVFEDAAKTITLADSGWLNTNQESIRSWQPYNEFGPFTDYFWTAKVSDGVNEVLCVDSQFSNGVNIEPQTGYQLNAPAFQALTGIDVDLTVDAPTGVLLDIELDDQPDFSSPQVFSQVVDASGQVIWSQSGLTHDTVYYWRARGSDQPNTRYGRWQHGQFTTVALAGEPLVQVVNPSNQSWVTTVTPELSIAIDSHNGFADTFQVDIYEDDQATVLFNSQVVDQPTALSPALNDRSRYYWQAKALHGDGSETPFTPLQSFFVIDDLVNDAPAFEFVSLQQATTTAASQFRIEWLDSDADSDANIDLYYDLDNSGNDGTLIVAGLSENGDDFYDWDISGLVGETIYLYAEIADGSSTVVSYSSSTLRIEASLIEVLVVDDAVSEAGDQATVTVTLMNQPEDYVIIPVSVSDENELSTDVSELFFDLNNWSVSQNITVTGLDDTVVDGDQLVLLQFGPVQSADADYAASQITDVEITNVDDDIPGVLFSALAGTTTSEAGDVIGFEVTLLTEPAADVILDFSSSDSAEGVVSPTQLTFTAANWNTPQTIDVTGQDDAVVDGDVLYDINTTVSSADVNYDAMAVDPLSITNTDDDVAGVNVTAIGGLTTTEAGGIAVFEVTLNSEPQQDVTIDLVSSDESEGLLDVSSMLFTAANWDQAQTVTVTGQDDPVVDGDQPYVLSLTSSSADVNYAGLVIADVALTNEDDDSIGLIMTPQGALQTSEAGGAFDVTVSLTAEPTADVTLSFSSSDPSEGMPAPALLVFTAANWNNAQTVTITGQDDALIDGEQVYQINTAVSSSDVSYDGLAVPAIDASNSDDDVAGVVVSPTTGLTTTESGGTATFTVVMTAEPTADVVINFNSSDVNEGNVTNSVTFTSADWHVAQNVLVTGVDDALDDGDVAYTINGAVSSTDGDFDGLPVSTVQVTNIDDDVAAVILTNLSGYETDEAGQLQAQFDVSLSLAPTADVILDFNVSDATEAQIVSSQLTFTPGNWSQTQVLTVDGLNDALIDYDMAYDLTYVISSADTAYAALVPEVIGLVNLDDDVPQLIEVFYTDLDSAGAQALCDAAAAQVSEPDQVCVHSEPGATQPNWSYNGLLRWPASNGTDHHATFYYGINCPVGSYLDFNAGCVNEDDQGPQTMSPVGEGGGTVIAQGVNVATGNHHHYEPLIDLGHGLTFGVTYNSHTQVDAFGQPMIGEAGQVWTHDYNRAVSDIYVDELGINWVDVTRPDGRVYRYHLAQTQWVALNNVKSDLQQTTKGWVLSAKNGDIEYYDLQGRLVEIRLHSGEKLEIEHNAGSMRVSNEYGLFIDIYYDVVDSVVRLTGVIDQTSRMWGFDYALDNLLHINYPTNVGLSRKVFHYENVVLPYLMTGITDQRGLRYSTYSHDSRGRLIASELAGGVNRIDVAYLANNARTLTNSLNSVSNLEVEQNGQLWRLKSFAGPGCSTCEVGNESFVFDGQNNLITHTVDGIVTSYGGYDIKGQNAYRIEADEPGTGPQERRYDFTYDSRFFGKVTSISEPSVAAGLNKVTSYVYNGFGRLQSVSRSGYDATGLVAMNQTTTHTLAGPFNQVSLTDGPRPGAIDQTAYTYYSDENAIPTRQNRLKRVTGPEGLVERDHIRWSETGKVTEEQRPNGVTIQHAYVSQTDQLLSTSITDGISTRVTQYSYLPTGHLSSVTENHGTTEVTTLTLSYDSALRLTGVTDQADNRIEYTLDTEGNLLSEKVYGKGAALPRKVINQTFDVNGHLASWQQAGVTVTYNHGSDGLLNSMTNGNGVTTEYSYDSLQRLTQKVQDLNGPDPTTANTTTQYTHDAGGRVKTVTDARGLVTTHVYDDLGNLKNHTSPDSGATSRSHDAAGNVIIRSDANGNTVDMSYDGRNRLTMVEFADSSLDQVFFYDQGVNGTGHMTSFMDQSGQTAFTYDAFGNLTSKAQVVNGFNDIAYAGFNDLTISYTYDAYNRVSTMTYPTGMSLSYEYDELNQVRKIISTSPSGINTTLVDNVGYLPFGPVDAIYFGNNVDYNATHDNGYRLSGYNYGFDVGAVINRDNNHNITYITRANVDNDWFSYDRLDRLTHDSHGTTDFVYDRVGNRTMMEQGGGAVAKSLSSMPGSVDESLSETLITTYQIDPNSNRLLSINSGASRLYDANGNTLQTDHDGNKVWTYNQANRMSSHTQSGITRGLYYYNAIGERVHKTHNNTSGGLAGEFLYLYDPNGRLVHASKYKNGQHIWTRENVYLGDRLVAQIRKFYTLGTLSSDDIYYIQTDHVHTPRWVTDDSGVRIWEMEADAFGTGNFDADVDGDGSNFHFFLRSSGQYFDGESKLQHNYMRDYDPVIGRFMQSSPVGVEIDLNPYEFANGSPIMQMHTDGIHLDQPATCDGLINDFRQACRAGQMPDLLTPTGLGIMLEPTADPTGR